MFEGLSSKLLSIFDNIRKRGVLTDEIIDATIREIRVSLLEADVALSVVRSFTEKLKVELKDQKVINSITPEQTIIKIVYDELVGLLGSGEEDNNPIEKRRGGVLIAGLQGTGKTTTSAKFATLLKNKWKRKVLLVSLDTARPAAIEQLQKLSDKNGIDFFNDIDLSKDTPVSIAKKASKLQDDYDVIIYDTAGRLYIDEDLMNEVASVKKIINPRETILVIDSMMGQDAVNTAKTFNENLGITGLILTRVDGDSRGGAALSAKSVTGCQIKYMCTGEKIDDIEVFHPDRIASRILDKGDVLSLVEKAMDENIAAEVKEVSVGKDFDLAGMETYLKQMEKMGGIAGFLKFIPGMGKIKDAIKEANINDKMIARQIAIIRSMTMFERKNPKILNASRKKRIASGCGQEVSEVNRLLKQFDQVKLMMTKFSNPGMAAKLMNRMK